MYSSSWGLTHPPIHSHIRLLSCLSGDTEGPNILMQAGLYPDVPRNPEPPLLGVKAAGPAQLKAQGA